jgi:hypothetical protein
MTMTGGCLCGAVRYAATGAPAYAGLCHCLDCQRATGTGHSAYAGFPRERVTIHGMTRAFAVIGGSGARSLRHFCPTCGTHVFGVRDPDDGTYTIYAGTLDDPELFAPREAIFVRSRRRWDHGTPPLPEFQTLP